jgi:hypothetical protein
MFRLVGMLVVGVISGPALADSPPTVAELVAQLGDPSFATREKAQKALLERGEGIVPELDKLVKTADPETAERIGKIRYDLVGYLDDIKRLLVAVDNRPDYVPDPISDKLRDLITGHQPRAGEFLLQLATDPKHDLHLRATRAFLQTWQSVTAAQLDRYIQSRVYLTTNHRSKFPAKVGAMIPMEAKIRGGWSAWFTIDGETPFVMKTRTTRYVDGKPYDKPFEYRHPFATVGWYKVGELAEGKHTIHAVLDYEFTHRGEKRTGEIRSPTSSFEVVSADTPDDLIAPRSDSQFKRVKTALETVRAPPPREPAIGIGIGSPSPSESDVVQVNWELTPGGKRTGLTCPRWDIRTPLDVDLCFDVEIHDVKTGRVFPAEPILLRKGESGSGNLVPQDVHAFAGDREGPVTVKIVRKPSRARALSDPKVTRYFPDTITTDDLRIKVIRNLPPYPPSPKW